MRLLIDGKNPKEFEDVDTNGRLRIYLLKNTDKICIIVLKNLMLPRIERGGGLYQNREGIDITNPRRYFKNGPTQLCYSISDDDYFVANRFDLVELNANIHYPEIINMVMPKVRRILSLLKFGQDKLNGKRVLDTELAISFVAKEKKNKKKPSKKKKDKNKK